MSNRQWIYNTILGFGNWRYKFRSHQHRDDKLFLEPWTWGNCLGTEHGAERRSPGTEPGGDSSLLRTRHSVRS